MTVKELLLSEHPIIIIPKLACAIGVNESIVLQQINYWLDIHEKAGNNYVDGHYWVYNTIQQWKEQFPFFSESTIRRSIKNLEDSGVLVSKKLTSGSNVKWYRIDYSISFDEPPAQSEQAPVQIEQVHLFNLNKSLYTETTAEITTETTEKEYKYSGDAAEYIFSIDDDVLEFADWYTNKHYPAVFGKPHPHVFGDVLNSALERISNHYTANGCDIDTLKAEAREFTSNVESDTHSITHFGASDKMLILLYGRLGNGPAAEYWDWLKEG